MNTQYPYTPSRSPVSCGTAAAKQAKAAKAAATIAVAVALFAASCSPETENVFGESAANRVAATQAACYDILKSQQQGWVIDFYPSDRTQGGVAYTARFTDTEVTLTCEQTIVNTVTAQTYPVGTEVSSLYQITGEKGVLLTFDTYNPLLHYWSQPFAGHAKGYQSDYEFIFLSASPDSVVLQGKKHGNLLKMYPLHQQATDYVARVEQTRAVLEGIIRKRAIVDGTTHHITLAYNQLSYTDGTQSLSMPFVYTDGGLRLYEPVTIGGATISNLVYNAQADDLTSPDGHVVLPSPTATERFVGTTTQWYFGYSSTGGATDMCDELAAITADCAKRIKTPNWGYEVLGAIYLGANLLSPDRDAHRMVIGWRTNANYGRGNAAYFGYAITMDMADDARQLITLQPTEAATGFGDKIYCQAFVDFIAGGSPYLIAFEGEDRVTLTSQRDAAKWFCLTRSPTAN